MQKPGGFGESSCGLHGLPGFLLGFCASEPRLLQRLLGLPVLPCHCQLPVFFTEGKESTFHEPFHSQNHLGLMREVRLSIMMTSCSFKVKLTSCLSVPVRSRSLPLCGRSHNTVLACFHVYLQIQWWFLCFCFSERSTRRSLTNTCEFNIYLLLSLRGKHYRAQTRQTCQTIAVGRVMILNMWGGVLHPRCPCWLVSSCDHCSSLLMQVLHFWQMT